MEETGLKGRFAGVLYVSEFLQEGRHTVDVTAWVEVGEGGEAQLGSDPEVEEGSDATLKDVRWVGFEELEEMTVLPEFVRNRIVEDQAHGWSTNKVYLGSADA
jgi:ADP-ribose pyrophosphatase YjhB (NUDIX family)